MQGARGRLLFLACLCALACLSSTETSAAKAVKAQGLLTDNQIIESKALGYKLQYRAYLPPGHATLQDLPSIYIADGQWYLSQGAMVRLLDRMIQKGRIEPIVAIFIDNRDPDNLSVNRRNQQFFCNQSYADFVSDELIPRVNGRYRTRPHREERVILGLSFGGLNAACFGLQAQKSFAGVAMQSPALHPVPKIYEAYEESPKLPLRFFLSTGTQKDNAPSARRLKNILKDKGYELEYVEVPEGHDWQNWKPLLADVLLFFFGSKR